MLLSQSQTQHLCTCAKQSRIKGEQGHNPKWQQFALPFQGFKHRRWIWEMGQLFPSAQPVGSLWSKLVFYSDLCLTGKAIAQLTQGLQIICPFSKEISFSSWLGPWVSGGLGRAGLHSTTSEVVSNLNDSVVLSIQSPGILLVRKPCGLWVAVEWLNLCLHRWDVGEQPPEVMLKSLPMFLWELWLGKAADAFVILCDPLWSDDLWAFLPPSTPPARQQQRKEYFSHISPQTLISARYTTPQVKLFLQHYHHKPPSSGCTEIPKMSCVGPGLQSPVDHYSSEHSLANYWGS